MNYLNMAMAWNEIVLQVSENSQLDYKQGV